MSVYKPGVYLMIEKNVHWKHTDPVHHPENHKTRSSKSIEEIRNLFFSKIKDCSLKSKINFKSNTQKRVEELK